MGVFFLLKKKENKKKRNQIRQTVADVLEFPPEVAMDLPKITLAGQMLLVENHKGIIEYSNQKIRLKVGGGWLEINGQNMILKAIRNEELAISGKVEKLILETGW